MSGFGRLARAVLACAAATAAVSAAAEAGTNPSTDSGRQGSLAAYLGLAAGYQAGNTDSAVRQILGWAWLDIDAAVRDLRGADLSRVDLRLPEAAALMHLQACLLSLKQRDIDTATTHLRAAMRVFEWTRAAVARHDQLRLHLAPSAFYAALAGGCQWFGSPLLADDAATRGLERIPAEPQLLYVAGYVREGLSFWYQAERRPRQATRARQQAAALYRSALRASPGNADARLRLGRILLYGDHLAEAERLLQPLAANPDDGRIRHLAWLFLGRVHERRHHWNEARAAYARSLGERPDSAAARIALAWATEQLSGAAAARELLADHLHPTPPADDANDPWLAYPFGSRELVGQLLAALESSLRTP